MIELAVICGLLVALNAWLQYDRRLERQEIRQERADLLLRISETQQQTVMRHHYDGPVSAPPAVNPDLDDDYWVSKDDLAEMMARDEVNHGD